RPVIAISFTAALNTASAAANISFASNAGTIVPFTTTFQNHDSTVVITPTSSLAYLTKYTVMVSTNLTSAQKGELESAVTVSLTTQIDSTNKFPVISDDALLTLVQQQTFKYFW